MKTPFTLLFDQSSMALANVGRRPFVPTYALPFVGQAVTAYRVGGTCQLIYRWHDAFDVFVAVLEAFSLEPLEIPVASHLFDLHLVYQLHGASQIIPEAAGPTVRDPIELIEGHRMEVYTPPARAVLRLRPDRLTHRYALAAVVPKGDWITRHPAQGESPMEALIQHLRQRYAEHRYLHPAPITPAMHAWLHLLFSTPPYAGMALDNALNGPMVELVDAHRREYLRTAHEKQRKEVAGAARLLVRELVARMDGEKPVTVNDVAEAMHITRHELWKAHYAEHLTGITHYINDCMMARAKELLGEGRTVKDVGMFLGYSTPNNFSRSFKKKYGISPDDYRKRNGH